jgi:hypothetical protein
LTNDRKIKANRANARVSTGPRTVEGRTRSARNALRHGLSLRVCSDPALCEEVEALARDIAGTDANAEILELARRVAEAQIDLRRVHSARHKLLSDALGDPFYESRKTALEKLRFISSLARPNAPDIPLPVLERYLTSTPKGPEKFATILSQEAKRLLAMDRYERRALFRRKTAIQVFDVARQSGCSEKGSNLRLQSAQNEAKFPNKIK